MSKDMHAKPYKVAGRRYTLAYLRLRAKRVKAKNREYAQYYINVPRSLAEVILGGRNLPEPGGPGVLLTVIAAPSPWFHALDWSQIPLHDLPEHVQGEIRAMGLDRLDEETVFISASREEIEALGLDPDRPLTLRDVIEALKAKSLRIAEPAK